jgi:hypothetical protein
VIKFVGIFRQVGGFRGVLLISSTNINNSHDITEILLKVALNTINQTKSIKVRTLIRKIMVYNM